ncbi:MAG TPA: DUF3311 domain-containing protein [Stenotrophobium sp.]|jgi:hypothetical protein|nr:DUF3311 domain-containing protein [Stenotrophobium sp.]
MKKTGRGTRVFWLLMMLAVMIVSLWVPLYNRDEPRLAGIPFFYWFQFGWIVVCAVVTALAYRARV